MIAKILSKTGTFNAVQYNTSKLDKQTGELMRIKNFGLLQDDFRLQPEEVKNYLKSISALNPRVKNAQFHATISCLGKEYDKEQLSDIAEKWVHKMGYGENPYIIVFHNDTDNNHVHIVSTRIKMDGKTVSDSMEKLRAVDAISQIMKQDPSRKIANDIQSIEGYSFSTIAQYKMLWEQANYNTKETSDDLVIYKGGHEVASYPLRDLQQKAESHEKDTKRIMQIRQFIKKYKSEFDNTLVPERMKLKGDRVGDIVGYKSDLTEGLRAKFGLQFVFHFSGDKQPYGYTIIDRKNKSVIKGSDVLKLKELIEVKATKNITRQESLMLLLKNYNIESMEHLKLLAKHYKLPHYKIEPNGRTLGEAEKSYYKDLLRFYLANHNFQDLEKLNIVPIKESNTWYLLDTGTMNILEAKEVLPKYEYEQLMEEQDSKRDYSHSIDNNQTWLPTFGWDLASDVDDERAHGRERNKDRNKGKKR